MPGQFRVTFPSGPFNPSEPVLVVLLRTSGIPCGSYELSVTFIYFLGEIIEEIEETFEVVITDGESTDGFSEFEVPLTVPHDLGHSSHDIGAVRFLVHDLCTPQGSVAPGRIHLIRVSWDRLTFSDEQPFYN